MRRRGARLPVVAAASAALALVASGCAQPEYTYISSSDRDVVLRVPRTWSPMNTDAVLKASGQDPASIEHGWLVYYDADQTPNQLHPFTIGNRQPVLVATSQAVQSGTEAALTDDVLRDFMVSVTPAARQTDDLQRAAAGQPPRQFALVSDQVVNTRTEHGVHTIFQVTIGAQTEFYDQLVVTDPKKKKIHSVLVHCSKACFQADRSQIVDAVDSLTLKKP